MCIRDSPSSLPCGSVLVWPGLALSPGLLSLHSGWQAARATSPAACVGPAESRVRLMSNLNLSAGQPASLRLSAGSGPGSV
eukprot:3932389-Rhodomonas_salina.1